jgi:hypothetical protein
MSVELLERAAQALERVLNEVVFLGGASVVLWITDPALASPGQRSGEPRLRRHDRSD